MQNKIDLVTDQAALQQHEAIQKFIQGTIADGAPVVPVSAQLKYNVDVVCEYLVKRIPVPVRCACRILLLSAFSLFALLCAGRLAAPAVATTHAHHTCAGTSSHRPI